MDGRRDVRSEGEGKIGSAEWRLISCRKESDHVCVCEWFCARKRVFTYYSLCLYLMK